QEAPSDGEPGHKQKAEPEDGNGDAELRQHGNQPAIPAIRLEGGKNAERQGDDDREAEAEPGERQSDGQPAADFAQDRRVADEGRTEIKPRKLAEEGEELHQ